MKKSDIEGWKNVYSFTFVQHYKNKATLIALFLLVILVILSGPLLTTVVGSSGAAIVSNFTECKIENAYVKNETDFDMDFAKFAEENPHYEKINYVKTDKSMDSLFEDFKENSVNDIILNILYDKDDSKYKLQVYKTKDSGINDVTLTTFSDDIEAFFRKIRMEKLGVSDDDVKLVNSECETDVINISDITKNNSEEKKAAMMGIVSVYACVIMVLVLVSSQQIAVSIIVEKSSKIMENLLISVRPLAIIVGKILGTMTIVVCDIGIVLVSGGISAIITSFINAGKMKESFTELLENMDSMSAQGASSAPSAPSLISDGDINIGKIIFGLFAVFITTILAFLLYSVIAGIAGAACKSMEDYSSASGFVAIFSIMGLYISVGESFVNNRVFTIISYIFPFSGMYILPVHYLFGEANILFIFLMWIILIALIIFLFKFAANIYHVLVLHNGDRIKIKQMISISKSNRKKG